MDRFFFASAAAMAFIGAGVSLAIGETAAAVWAVAAAVANGMLALDA